jgi:tetratricopeptide (TPR) repeat protein
MGERHALIVRVANTEFWLGRDEEAMERLHVALAGLPAEPSDDRVRLRYSLALNLVQTCEIEAGRDQLADGLADARALGDRVLEAAGLSLEALCAAAMAEPRAIDARERAVAAFGTLTELEAATRLPGLWMIAWADTAEGRFDAALASLERARAAAAATGRELVLMLVTLGSVRPLIELGRLDEALDAAEEGIDRARITGSAQFLLWGQSAVATARLAAGDVSAVMREDEFVTGVPRSLHATAQPSWCLGTALMATGNARPAGCS